MNIMLCHMFYQRQRVLTKFSGQESAKGLEIAVEMGRQGSDNKGFLYASYCLQTRSKSMAKSLRDPYGFQLMAARLALVNLLRAYACLPDTAALYIYRTHGTPPNIPHHSQQLWSAAVGRETCRTWHALKGLLFGNYVQVTSHDPRACVPRLRGGLKG